MDKFTLGIVTIIIVALLLLCSIGCNTVNGLLEDGAYLMQSAADSVSVDNND